jgi:hypothetical protein
MSAQLQFPRRTLRRALLATLTFVCTLAVVVPAANAAVTINASIQRAGLITSGGGLLPFATCDATGNQNDDNAVGFAELQVHRPGDDQGGRLLAAAAHGLETVPRRSGARGRPCF